MIDFFLDQLKGLYPAEEVEGLIFYAFNHIMGFTRNQLLTEKDKHINESDLLIFFRIIRELKEHKPIQYILEEADFYNLKFKVNEHVLIPRPETEELVDWIIRDNKNKSLKILDIGTGSGCIAISIKKNIKDADVYAMDISKDALAVAKENANKNGVEINFIPDDILKPKTDATFDIIVSNPPYVKKEESKLMNKNVLDFEPHLALFVNDQDPLLFYKAIITFAKDHLSGAGSLYFEINESYGNEMEKLLSGEGFNSILKKDLSGKDRMIKAQRKENE